MSVVAGAALALVSATFGATGAGAASTPAKVAASTTTDAASSLVTVTVAVDRAPAHSLAVDVTTVDGTAHAGRDYTALAKKVTFTPTGSRTSTLTIALLAPNAPDGRTFTIALRTRKATVTTPSVTVVIHPPETMTQHELRAALAVEDQWRAQYSSYTAGTLELMTTAPGLPWGTRLAVTADAHGEVVCIQETSASGQVFAIAEIAVRANAGIYTMRHACPATPSEVSFVGQVNAW